MNHHIALRKYHGNLQVSCLKFHRALKWNPLYTFIMIRINLTRLTVSRIVYRSISIHVWLVLI